MARGGVGGNTLAALERSVIGMTVCYYCGKAHGASIMCELANRPVMWEGGGAS